MPASIRFGRSGASYLTRTTGLPPVTNWLTWMAWVMPLSTPNTNNYVVQMLPDVYLYYTATLWVIPDYTGGWLSIGSVTPAGTWEHIAFVNNGSGAGNARYYRGGKYYDKATGCTTTTPVTAIWLGQVSGLGAYWGDFRLAGLKLWNRPLSDAEVAAEALFALPINRAGLNSCYPVPNGWDMLSSGVAYPRSALTRWADWSGNGLEWTETGTIDTEDGPPILWSPLSARRSLGLRGAGGFPPGGIWRPLVHSQRAA